MNQLICPFTKYSATGNDFFIIDNRENRLPTVSTETWRRLCERRLGIGSDGLLLLEKAQNSSIADYKMSYYNADGQECSMCGNGARALVHFACSKGQRPFHQDGFFRFETMNSLYKAKIDGELVSVFMNELRDVGTINVDDLFPAKHSLFLNTGVPHVVFEVKNLKNLDVKTLGEKIGHDKRFPEGVNVNFFEIMSEDKKTIHVRTFERGVEDETLACGTGVTAVAIACREFFGLGGQIHISVPGGPLTIDLSAQDDSVLFSGKVKKIFDGQFDLLHWI